MKKVKARQTEKIKRAIRKRSLRFTNLLLSESTWTKRQLDCSRKLVIFVTIKSIAAQHLIKTTSSQLNLVTSRRTTRAKREKITNKRNNRQSSQKINKTRLANSNNNCKNSTITISTEITRKSTVSNASPQTTIITEMINLENTKRKSKRTRTRNSQNRARKMTKRKIKRVPITSMAWCLMTVITEYFWLWI